MASRYKTTSKARHHWGLLRLYNVKDLDTTEMISNHMQHLTEKFPEIITPALIQEGVELRKRMTDRKWAKQQICVQCSLDECTVEDIRSLFFHDIVNNEEGSFMNRVSHIVVKDASELMRELTKEGFLECNL